MANADGWRPIETALKDGKPKLLKLKDPIPREGRPDLAIWDGLAFVGRHTGLSAGGFDHGWQFAAPVGQGGFPDVWFEGWRPIEDEPHLDTTGGAERSDASELKSPDLDVREIVEALKEAVRDGGIADQLGRYWTLRDYLQQQQVRDEAAALIRRAATTLAQYQARHTGQGEGT